MNTNAHLEPTAQVSDLCDVKPPDKITWLKNKFLMSQHGLWVVKRSI